jgi:gamma-glutamyltranspeptidase/glutathione hydrolase
VTADIRLGAETLAALAAEDTVTEVEHAVLPVNFACPNLIQIGADGLRTGITDVMSPWSAAIAEA